MQRTKFYVSCTAGLLVGGISLLFFVLSGLVFGFVLDPYFGILLWMMPIVPAVIGFATGRVSAEWRKASPLGPTKEGGIAGLSAAVLTSLGWIIEIVIIEPDPQAIWSDKDTLLYCLLHILLLVPLISMLIANWIGFCPKVESVNSKNIRLEILRKFVRSIVCIIVFLYVGLQSLVSVLMSITSDRYYTNNRRFIYWQGKKIIGSDGSTFKQLGRSGARDKNFVYYRGKKINGIDVNSFMQLENEYAKDKNFVFWEMTRIPEADTETFKVINATNETETLIVINDSYARDKNFVYHGGKRIPEADGKSFEVIDSSGSYAKDKNYVYFLEKKVESADSNSIKVLVHPYAKDKNYVYYYGNKIIGADVDSIEILEYNEYVTDYAKDKQSVYYKNKRIEGSDAPTFEILLTNGGYAGEAKDKNFTYQWGRKVK